MHTITVAGKSYNVEPRYAAGHVLNDNEASALNQTFFENLRNNFAGKAKEGADQVAFDEYASAYAFGVRSGGGSRDPVEVEAMELARETVKDIARKAGKKLSEISGTAISQVAAKLLEHPEKGPQIRELARQRVEQMRLAASNEVDSDLMSVLAEAETANPVKKTDETPASDESDDSAAPATGRRAKASA